MQEFQVGDIVRIRDWDDMADEFGVNSYGSIRCNGNFIPDMRYLCGLESKIVSIDNVRIFNSGRYGYVVHLERKEEFMITNEMLEFVRSQKELVCVNTTVIDDFLDVRRV